MLCITKCQRFMCYFSEIDVWSPITTKRIISHPIIAIFSSWSARVKKKKTMKKLERDQENILHRLIVWPEKFYSD